MSTIADLAIAVRRLERISTAMLGQKCRAHFTAQRHDACADHHLGYDARHHEDVEPVCTTCHRRRDG